MEKRRHRIKHTEVAAESVGAVLHLLQREFLTRKIPCFHVALSGYRRAGKQKATSWGH